MKNYICAILGFISGAGAGVFAGKLLYEKKYAAIAQEEIDSVKEEFRASRAKVERNNRRQEPDHLKAKPTLGEMKEYVRTIEEQGYIPTKKEPEPPKEPDYPPIEIIAPEDYEDESDGYDPESLTLYSDGVLVDEANQRLAPKEIEEMIGKDALNHFGEYEDDAVYVKNNVNKVKYEIVRDERAYTDTLNT